MERRGVTHLLVARPRRWRDAAQRGVILMRTEAARVYLLPLPLSSAAGAPCASVTCFLTSAMANVNPNRVP